MRLAPDGQAVVATADPNNDGDADSCDVLGPSALSGKDVSGARAFTPQGNWVVEFDLKQPALAPFNALAQHCFDMDATCPGRIAIVLDGGVLSNPAPQTPTYQCTKVEISGKFGEQQAKSLAALIGTGALPTAFQPVVGSSPDLHILRFPVSGQHSGLLVTIHADNVADRVDAIVRRIDGFGTAGAMATVENGRVWLYVFGTSDQTAVARAISSSAGVDQTTLEITTATTV